MSKSGSGHLLHFECAPATAPKRPLDYLGSAGLLWAINGGRLLELHRDWAVIDQVRAIIDPQGRGRQYVATYLARLTGTRAAGLVLTRQDPAGKWAAGTYVLTNTAPAEQAVGGRSMSAVPPIASKFCAPQLKTPSDNRDQSAPQQKVAYSMTSSARASTVAGNSRPSALAVFSLSTSSNLDGVDVGREPAHDHIGINKNKPAAGMID